MGRGAHLLVEVAGEEFELNGLGGAVNGDIGAEIVLEGEKVVEDAALLVVVAKLPVDGIGQGVEAHAARGGAIVAAPGGVNDHVLISLHSEKAELRGVGNAEAGIQKLVRQREDGGVGSDGEGE